jgi:hypothetical protein
MAVRCIAVNTGDFFIESPNDPDRVAVGESYGIDDSGKVIGEIPIPNSATYFVTSWIVPASYSGPLEIVHSETGFIVKLASDFP